VSQTANLSQAKTLLYSAIHGKFAYTIQDWNHLNHEEFDSLARSLLDRCSSANELAFRLLGAASCLEPPQNYESIAQVLYRSLKTVYETWQPSVDSVIDEDTDTTDPTSVTSSNTSSPPSTGLSARDRDESDRTQIGVGSEVEATLQATTTHHVQAAISAIEQQAKALVEDIHNLVAHADPDTAKAIEDRCLHEFSTTLQQFYRQLDRPTQP
jgi:predicted nuclease of restriction endonuclease-like RecB superfamily